MELHPPWSPHPFPTHPRHQMSKLSTNLHQSAFLMTLFSLALLPILSRKNAPYGRYGRTSKSQLPARLVWLLFESPNLLIPLFIYHTADSPGLSSSQNLSCLLFFLLHYLHRSLLYPLFRMPPNTTSVSIPVFLSATVFCIWNAWQQSISLMRVTPARTDMRDGLFLLGLTAAILGLCINVHSDSILLTLRAKGTGYHVPYGGLFRYVSGANYLGEIVEWAGWALACRSWPTAAFAVATICNTAPRARAHHLRYLHRFKQYPRERFALVPFLW